ncbi:MAG: hypothetical protein K9M56_07115 [Victivallales bacterium]|nr:hypothetical protein [Victivallales bacterium]
MGKYFAVFLIFAGLFFLNSAYSAKAMTYEETQYAADLKVTKNHKKAVKDPTYPRYHLRAPSGWINDPCGLFYFNSSFHVFCQSNPWGSQWGNMTWSHIVSCPDEKFNFKWFYPKYKDGVYKTSAIMQSLNIKGADKDGVFTGCAAVLPFNEIDKQGKKILVYYPAVFYSGVWGIAESKQEVICLARALKANKVDEEGNLCDPFLTEWTKYSTVPEKYSDSNPDIIIKQPEKLDLFSFRDPYLVDIIGDYNYYMIISGGIRNKVGKPEGVFILYRNDGGDLTKNWKRVNKGKNFFFSVDTAVKDELTGGGDIECGVVYRLTDHIGTTNNTPYIAVFGKDGPSDEPYGKSLYYVLGRINKSDEGIFFQPLEDFKDGNGNTIIKHIDLNPDFVLYASNTVNIDNEQRKYVYGWLNVSSQANDGKKYPWAGALSIPRFLFVYKEEGRWKLGQEPVLVNSLRENIVYENKINFKNCNDVVLDGVKGRTINISAVFKGKDIISSVFGLKVACCKNKCTLVKIDNGKLIINGKNPVTLDIPGNSEKYGVKVYLDGSTMEIFFVKYPNGKPVYYRTYSDVLPNNGGIIENKVKVFGGNNMSADVIVFEMGKCWDICSVTSN